MSGAEIGKDGIAVKLARPDGRWPAVAEASG
jgi:hypothetical protein